MRSYINKGQLPPYQAIRPEEFVNYFKQDYTPPNEKGFAIYADAAPSPFQHDGSILLRVGVQAYRVPENQRKPVALTFVIDISGSMNMENRLGLVKKSLGMLIERLRRDDTVSIVVFGSNARVLLYPTVVADKNKILEAIWSMQTEGATNTEAGLKLGYDMAMRQYLPGGNNRVMMLSDGVGNVGTTDPIKLINGVKGSAPADVALSTIGFGMNNFNDVMLEQLANKGNGFYAYVDTVEEARRLFLDRTTQTLELIAKDAKVQVEFNPDVVASYRLVGYENRAIADQDFRNDTVSAGGMNSGHNATAIYAVKLHPGAQGKINTVYMRWQNPDTRQIREVSGDFNTWDIANSLEQTSARYQLSVVAVQFAEILRRSPYTNATFGQLSDYATIIARNFPNESEVQEFASLVQKAARLAN
jgi:Ca-activated chloride channel family protein